MKKTLLHHIAYWWWLIVGLTAALILVWQLTVWTYRSAVDELSTTGVERLDLYEATLDEALSRYAYLPFVLSQNIDIQIMLRSLFNVELVNHYLEKLSSEAGSEALYVMGRVGDTIASSNWREPLTYVGKNYGYRPYFTDAKDGKKGRFFAIGATTGIPGYFLSHPVFLDGQFLGATVVKIDLARLQEDWRRGGETVLVSDANGVLFLSSHDRWRYQTLAPLSEAQRAIIKAGRQYGNQPLTPVDLTIIGQLDPNRALVRLGQEDFIKISRPVSGMDWTIHHLSSMTMVQQRSQAVALTGIIATLLLLSVGMFLRERRQKVLSRRKAREAEAIKLANERLQTEVAERTKTANALRETQDELIQAGKLAALGHMAAGIVHELNQPISAIKTQAASGRLLLDRQQTDKVRETLDAVTRITEHMGSITKQLKSFAYKGEIRKEPVVLQESLDGALAITGPLLVKNTVEVALDIPTEPLEIHAVSGRMKQVFINLIRNAIDAMTDSTVRCLEIKITKGDSEIDISIRDTGPGIPERAHDELFTPFFTTKDVGEGLGLGLSISYRIINDLNGTIRVVNHPEGGACFDIRLPLEEQEDKSHG